MLAKKTIKAIQVQPSINICDVRNLVPFEQFKKTWKTSMEELYF